MEDSKSNTNYTFKPKQFHLINSSFKANIVIDQILSNEYAVIGVDIEAAVEMSRFGILCLLQISYNNSAYIFDMIEMKHEEIKLGELFARRNIIKVFHDCIEDVSLLYNLYNIKELKGIFDTQIAHRMCYNSNVVDVMNNCNKNTSISLADLIKDYLNIEYEIKGEMHSLMNLKPYLWKERPLSEKLIFYAGNDVLFLPQIYDIINSNCQKKLFSDVNLKTILTECNKYIEYVKINLKIKNFHKTNLQKNTEIQGLIKNYQFHCVFIQLNIGYIGVVTNPKSVGILKKDYSLGDIVQFKVIELEVHKKRYVLDLAGVVDNENETALKLAKRLNVCEKSFYPQSFLKMVNKKEETDENASIENYSIKSKSQEKDGNFSLYELIDNVKALAK